MTGAPLGLAVIGCGMAALADASAKLMAAASANSMDRSRISDAPGRKSLFAIIWDFSASRCALSAGASIKTARPVYNRDNRQCWPQNEQKIDYRAKREKKIGMG